MLAKLPQQIRKKVLSGDFVLLNNDFNSALASPNCVICQKPGSTAIGHYMTNDMFLYKCACNENFFIHSKNAPTLTDSPNLFTPPSVILPTDSLEKSLEIAQALETDETTPDSANDHLPYPKELFEYMGQYVIGQEHAKKVLSVAVYNHYKRLHSLETSNFENDRAVSFKRNEELDEEGPSVMTYNELLEFSTTPNSSSKKLAEIKEMQKDLLDLPTNTSDSQRLINLQSNSKQNKRDSFKNFLYRNDAIATKIEKSNILMVGPMGCGKTLLAKTIANCLNVPFAICDCTSLTQAGYVGDDIESVIGSLLEDADGDVEMAEQGIVFLDEVDKLAAVPSSTGGPLRDVSGEGVQQGLLKLLEGTVVQVPYKSTKRKNRKESIPVDTSNILFVASGAFSGLEKIISNRLNSKSVGFDATKADPNKPELDQNALNDLIHYATTDDIMYFGMIPEFLGRLPVLVPFEQLDLVSLVRILQEPKNAIIPQFKALMLMDSVRLDFTREALEEIAKEAKAQKTGARGLRAIVERILLEPMFEIPGSEEKVDTLVIDRNAVEGSKKVVTNAAE